MLRKIQTNLEKQVKANHPYADLEWVMPMRKNKDGTSGGRLKVTADGYRPKTYLVHADARGNWWTH